MSAPNLGTVARVAMILANDLGPVQSRASRWKLHLGQIADSAVGEQAQGLHRAMGRRPCGPVFSQQSLGG